MSDVHLEFWCILNSTFLFSSFQIKMWFESTFSHDCTSFLMCGVTKSCAIITFT